VISFQASGGVPQAMVMRIVSEADSLNRACVAGSTPGLASVTPLSMAQREGYADIVKLLKDHGAKH